MGVDGKSLYLMQSPAYAKHLLDGIAALDAGMGDEHEQTNGDRGISAFRVNDNVER